MKYEVAYYKKVYIGRLFEGALISLHPQQFYFLFSKPILLKVVADL